MNRRCRQAAAVIGALSALGAAAMASAGPASAKPVLTVAYRVGGTSTIAKTGSSVRLGPTVLTVALNSDGSFKARMPLPPTSTTFSALGLLPVSATVNFVGPGHVSGKLTSNPALHVAAASSYVIRLSDVTVAGVPTPVGNSCQTGKPVVINAATPKGKSFDIAKGGVLTGTFTIGSFVNCGLTTPLINALVPGPGNTVSLALSHGRRVD